jgi:hypothetical protein
VVPAAGPTPPHSATTQRKPNAICGLTERAESRGSSRWPASGTVGGRIWWAHFEFTGTNIAPTILYKKIEDL